MALHKQRVLRLVDRFLTIHQVERTDIAILGGAAMVLHGLCEEAEYIDLYVPEGILTRFHLPSVGKEFDIRSTYHDCELNSYYNLRIQTMESLLELKLKANRPKDFTDIRTLQDRIQQNVNKSKGTNMIIEDISKHKAFKRLDAEVKPGGFAVKITGVFERDSPEYGSIDEAYAKFQERYEDQQIALSGTIYEETLVELIRKEIQDAVPCALDVPKWRGSNRIARRIVALLKEQLQ